MIKEVTRHNRQVQNEIISKVGKGYRLLELFSIGRIGSQPVDILHYSEHFSVYFNSDYTTHRGNIELRKRGILFGFNLGQRSFVWAVPFIDLHIFTTDDKITIRDKERRIECQPSYNAPLDMFFIEKVNLFASQALNESRNDFI